MKYPKMKLSCAFSIVVLFVTAVNSTSTTATNTTASTSTSTAAINTTAANTSTPAATTNATAASTSTTTTSQAPTPMKYECIEQTCYVSGCLTNATSTKYCNGTFCKMEQRLTVITVNQTYYNITASCAASCTEKDEAYGNVTERTRCCQTNRCNINDAQIVALTPRNGGSASRQALVWILSIILSISAFEILM